MVIKPDIIWVRLKELDTVLEELGHYKDKQLEEFRASLSLRWAVERGLIAAANIVFDITDHILGGYFSIYPDTYEESLRDLKEKEVISAGLYQKLKGLGSFRNILVHDYLKIDLSEVYRNLTKAFKVFPAFSTEIQKWLQSLS